MRLFNCFIVVAICLLAVLASSVPAQAQSQPMTEEAPAEIRRYAVEIILFRYGSGVATGNERFLPDPPPVESLPEVDSPLFDDDELVPEFGDTYTDAVEAMDEPEELAELQIPTITVGLQLIPRDELELGDIHDKLERLDSYTPVLWAGWTQDAVEKDTSPAIPLRRIGDAPPDFDGTLKLYLSRFLHLVVDMTLTDRGDRAAVSGEFDASGWRIVRMTMAEDRIFKDGDLRYFDHPKFGLLAKVSRVEEVEEPVDEAAAGTVLPAIR